MCLEKAASHTHLHIHTQIHPPLVWSCLNSRDWFTNGCPQNKALLRKHHHQQPQQHVCWRRRRGGRKARHLHFNNQFPTVRGGRGQIFVVVLLRVPRPIKRGFFFCTLPFLFYQSIHLSPSSLQYVSLFASHVWRNTSWQAVVALGLPSVCSYCIFNAR